MGKLKGFIKRLSNFSLVFIILIWQVVFAGAPLFQSSLAHAAQQCTTDTAGANDVPNQKDLTKLCVDYSGSPTSVSTTWNWDDSGTQGSNSMDACNLFDTDGDGFINYAVCVTTQGNPATFSALTTYSCSDKSVDTCSAPNATVSSGTTSCGVAQSATDPFPANVPNGPGDDYPNDTQGSCTIQLSTVGGANANLIDVCSYESSSPTSNPSDCVIAVPGKAKLEVVKDLVPNSDPGLFDLKIDGTTYATAVSDGGNTGEQIVTAENNNNTHIVLEAASSSSTTGLSDYTTAVVCKDQHGTGSTLASGSPTGTSTRQLSVDVAKDSDVVCTFTNTRQGGTITVTKVVNNNNGGTKIASDFPLFVNSTSVTSGQSNNFDAGQSYTISETNQSGYHQDSIVCKNTADNSTLTNPFTLSSNENVSCTITNSDIAPKLTLVKHVSGGTAVATDWTMSATPSDNQYSTLSGSGGFSEQTARANLNYTLGESGGPSGYSAGSWSCDGGSLTGSTLKLALADDVTCNITNTRDTGTLTVNKLLVPSNDSGLFNLSMNGPTNYTANDQGNNGTTGARTVDTGSYTVSEAAGTNTSLSNYSSSYSCVYGQTTVASGNAITSTSFNVAKDQSIVCTFTNTRYGSISGFKYEANADSSTVGALQSWTIYLYDSQNNLIGTTTTDSLGNFVFSNLLAGSYTLGENLQTGWTQIYSPSGVTLSAGQNLTDNNFGNFQNAEISGMKFNDVNGNHQKDSGENGLSGWTINLSKSDGHGGWTSDGSTVTGSGGAYSFTDLAPGNYKLCETSQTGWTQTYPTTNSGCNLVDVILSGHNYTDTNFGNQGQGTITVVKNVDDGFGHITSDVTNWSWGYSGTLGSASGLSTGSSNSESVAAGDYTVSETQKTDYHVTASSCTGESDTSVSTSKSVTVSPGEDVTCTFTNTRNTGTIEVVKNLLPSTDSGLFDLNIDGTTKAPDVTDGGTTDPVTVVTGMHEVSETAGTNTSLNNYESSYVCKDNGQQVKSGSGTSITDISVAYGDDVVCTFTNTRHATLTVVKNVDDGFGNVSNDVKTWTWGYDGVTYDDGLATGSDNSQELAAGDYSVWENQQTDYHFTSVACSDGTNTVRVDQAEQFDVTLDPGENLTCTFLNTRDTGTITVVKNLYPSNDSGKFNLQINGQDKVTDVGDGGTTGQVTVVTGDGYNVSETAGTGTDLKDYQSRYWCTNEQTYGSGTQSDSFSVEKDQNITCYFDNYRLGINVVKTGPATAEPGQTVTYTFTVTNTGYLPLGSITVNDDIAGAGVYQSGDTNNNGMLDTSETWIYTANYNIPKDQFNSVTNTVTACGVSGNPLEEFAALDVSGQQVCDQDSHTLVIPKVLAEVTPPKVLANTGQSAWQGVVAGLLMLGLIAGINTTAFILAKKQR